MEQKTSSHQLGSSICNDMKRAIWSAEMIKAISHPIRLQIVALLCAGTENVSGMAERLEIKQSIVSQHLRILRMNGLVEGKRQDGFSNYSLAEEHMKELIRCIEGCRAP
jgi:DNA-binding transcriptional ArsR family regulator